MKNYLGFQIEKITGLYDDTFGISTTGYVAGLQIRNITFGAQTLNELKNKIREYWLAQGKKLVGNIVLK